MCKKHLTSGQERALEVLRASEWGEGELETFLIQMGAPLEEEDGVFVYLDRLDMREMDDERLEKWEQELLEAHRARANRTTRKKAASARKVSIAQFKHELSDRKSVV